MNPQPSLFDAPATRGASRRDGPATSRRAGHSLCGQWLREQQSTVLEAVAARGSANAHEVQTWLRERGRSCPERNAIGSRFAELTDAGMVVMDGERPGATGRGQHVAWVTDAGRAWVDALKADRGVA